MRILLLLSMAAMYSIACAQSKTLSGVVKDSAAGEHVAGAQVFLHRHNSAAPIRRTTTNRLGFFTFANLTAGEYVLAAQHFQNARTQRRVVLPDSVEEIHLELYLESGSVQFPEIVVEGEARPDRTPIPVHEIQPELMRSLPSLGGEPDVFRPLLFLPGVKLGTELLGGLHVRGSSPDQNLVLFDGMSLLNPTHVGGLISVFSPDIVGSVRLTKDMTRAAYGGRTASLLEVETKEPARHQWGGSAGVSFLSSRLTLDGPVTDQAGILLSARRLYADAFVPLVGDPVKTPRYYFYDLNMKMRLNASSRDRFTLTAYSGRDVLWRSHDNTDIYFDIDWGNTAASLRWLRVLSPSVLLSTSVSFTSFSSTTSILSTLKVQNADWHSRSTIADLSLRSDVEIVLGDEERLHLGGEVTRNEYAAEAEDRHFGESLAMPARHALDAAAYVQHHTSLTSALSSVAGIRLSSVGDGRYTFLEPRAGLSLSLSDDLTLRSSFAIVHQYLHLVTRTEFSLPTDFWLRADSRIRPARATQFSGGLEIRLDGGNYQITLDGYSKRLASLYEYRMTLDGYGTLPTEENLLVGRGEAYGAEVLLQKTSGDFTGWLAYTLSWTRRQFDELNNGAPFYPQYDQRHEIALVGTYKANERWTLSATWTFSSGRPYTMPVGMYLLRSLGDEYLYFDYASINDRRLPAYHKLDLGATYTFTWFDLPFQLLLNIYNVYNRQNVFARYIKFERQSGTRPGTYLYIPSIRDVTLFPVLPTIGLSCTF
jgi:hypothetical protein